MRSQGFIGAAVVCVMAGGAAWAQTSSAPSLPPAAQAEAPASTGAAPAPAAAQEQRRAHRPSPRQPDPVPAVPAPAGYAMVQAVDGRSVMQIPVPHGWCRIEGRVLERSEMHGLLPAPVAPARAFAWLMPCDEYRNFEMDVMNGARPRPLEVAMVGRMQSGLPRGSEWRDGTAPSAPSADAILSDVIENAETAFNRREGRRFSWYRSGTIIRGDLLPTREIGGFTGGRMIATVSVPLGVGRGASEQGRGAITYWRTMPSPEVAPRVVRGLSCHGAALSAANGGRPMAAACDMADLTN